MTTLRSTACTLFLSIFLLQSSFAQEKIKLINSHDLLVDGIELYEDEKYEDAIEKFAQVDRNDSLYITALTEKSLAEMRLEDYEAAIATIQLAMNATDDLVPELFINLGTALDDSGDSVAALAVYERGHTLFPKNHIILFNKAVTLYKLGQFDQMMAALKQVLDINPNHPGTHFLLASVAAQEGAVVQCMLSLNAFLIFEPDTERSQNALALLEAISTEKPTKENAKGIKLSDGDDFSEIELLLQNKLALSKKYKVNCDFTDDFIKQNHLLMEKLEYNAGDKGFWMKFYVPFFKTLFEEDQFEDFTYYSLLSLQSEGVQSTLKKNLSGIKAFDAWWPDAWYNEHKMHQVVLNGKKTEAQFWYSDNGRLQLVGNIKTIGKNQVLVGAFELYNDNGCLDVKGQNDDTGKKTGDVYYYDVFGHLTDQITFDDDLYNGKYISYYKNGNVSRDATYKEGLLDGETKVYYYYGGLSELKYYKEGKLDGSYKSYYTNGTIEYDATYKNDEITGNLIKYFPDGKKQTESAYKDSKLNGLKTQYYRNGQQSSTENFVDGFVEGNYKTYYITGQLSSEGTAKEGADVGEYKSYYPDGKLEESINYDETGKLNGTKKVYDRDGILYYEWDYTKGEISGYRYYDKQGKLVSEGKRKLTKFPFTGYFENGSKRFQGDYDGSEQNGLWKYYDRYGNLTSDDPYVKGKTEGNYKSYYSNGNIKYQIKYVNDMRDGYYEEFYPNGILYEHGWYKEGMQVGSWKRYFPNGTIRWHLYFDDDIQHGWQSYFDENGKLETEYLMDYSLMLKVVDYDTAGLPIDTHELKDELFTLTDYHFNGNISFTGEYKNGDANGTFKWYGPGGQLITEGAYIDDEKDGSWKWYTIDGKPESESIYEFGRANGTWTNYYDNGKPEIVRTFLLDDQEGDLIRYYKNGQVDMKGPYQGDERNGAFNYYDETGQLQIVKYYTNGQVIGYSYNGADGNLVKMIPVSNGNGTIIGYYQNGKKSMEYTMSKGWFEGKYTEYFASGKVYEESIYKNDDYNGVRKVYYSNGKVRLEENYKDGVLDGETKEYTEDGKLKETIRYIQGDRFGERVLYNSAGKVVKTIYYYNDKIVYEK